MKKRIPTPKKLTPIAVAPNAETMRTEYSSVEFANDSERLGAFIRFVEVKQEYVASPYLVTRVQRTNLNALFSKIIKNSVFIVWFQFDSNISMLNIRTK